jgi:hypothetical protein
MEETEEVSGGFFMFCWRGGRGSAEILEIFFSVRPKLGRKGWPDKF